MRKLLIGINSRVVMQLKLDSTFDLISHTEIDLVEFDQYEFVYLFSWSYSKIKENIRLINIIPAEKLIFISTVAIFSCQYHKQWANYPNFKMHCENLVLEMGGRILRLGSIDPNSLRGFSLDYAYTSTDLLQNFLHQPDWPSNQKIINLFIIAKAPSGNRLINSMLVWLNEILPSSKFLQIPFVILSKALGSPNYGYTYDCHRYTHDELMIGYGALGSFYDKTHPSKSRKFIVSFAPNIFLNSYGFINTIIGKKNIGLAANWHGVLTKQVPNTRFVKKDVLLNVKRFYPPNNRTERSDVISIQRKNFWWEIQSLSESGNITYSFANRIILAAGPLENIRLLSGGRSLNASLDDDENAYIGLVSVDECIKNDLVRKFGPFLIFRHGLSLRDDLFIEVRPTLSRDEYLKDNGAPYYMETTLQIIRKLLSQFSISRINEAIFNKFGFGFSTKKLAVFCQVLKKDAISITCQDSVVKSLNRARLSKIAWKEIQELVKNSLPSFKAALSVYSFDGLHIQGGLNKNVKNTIDDIPDEFLLILGSPRDGRSNPFHTTRVLQEEIASLSNP